MNIDEQERIDAATRYLKGDRPSDIYRDLNRSEKWFFKWIKRFNTGDDKWYKSQSRAPKKMIVDYRTQDLDTIVRLKEFNYQINEEIKQFSREV